MRAALPRLCDGPSIYDVVRGHVTRDGELDDPRLGLPDDPPTESGGVRWPPGAMDGLTVHHAMVGEDSPKAHVPWTAHLVVAAAAEPTEHNLRALHGELARVSPLGHVDELLSAVHDADPDWDGVRAVARWLVTASANRRVVKAGIALLGLAGFADDDADIVWTLALHEELTLFAAVALARNDDRPDEMLWTLARRLHGWGRIHCVERLVTTRDERIKDWILRDGFRNTVMVEYLAWTAAVAGDLAGVLRDDPDREQIVAAGEILRALLSEGPSSDIGSYLDGEEAVGLFLEHLVVDDGTLEDFAAVEAIRDFLQDDGEWALAARERWSPTRARILEDFCVAVLHREHWPALVRDGLRSDDRRRFALADSAAAGLGIDTFDVHLERLRRDPLNNGWLRAWSQADGARAGILADLARDLLPLAEIATGPLDEHGLGCRFAAHRTLQWTLRALADHPGVGVELILAGLQSPVTRNRCAALEALDAWPCDVLPLALAEALSVLAARDPEPDNRPRARRLLESLSVPERHNLLP